MDSPEAIVEGLGARSRDITAVALLDPDGLPLASSLRGDLDAEEIAAICAMLLSSGEKLTEQLGQGKLTQVVFMGDAGLTILARAGEYILAVLTTPHARLGLVLMDVRRAASQLAAALE